MKSIVHYQTLTVVDTVMQSLQHSHTHVAVTAVESWQNSDASVTFRRYQNWRRQR
jgi:hypothetical protein